MQQEVRMSTSSDRVALVTGGASGIGRATVHRLASDGVTVVIADIDDEAGETAATELRSSGSSASYLHLDVADEASWEQAVSTIARDHGRLDILVNNAGITRDGLLIRMKDDDWDWVMETNLRGAFLMTRAAAKLMVRLKNGGRIINIASAAGAMGNAGQANYSAAKAGLIGLTKSSARELAHWNILVNAVAPGLIETDMAAAIPAEAREALLAQVPLKRIGSAREVAEMVGFLAGDGAAYVTGQVFHVNGGLYM
jgi:3-oxoacyl-[acyl-carrier protein] reductase